MNNRHRPKADIQNQATSSVFHPKYPLWRLPPSCCEDKGELTDNLYLNLFTLTFAILFIGTIGFMFWLHRSLPNEIAKKYPRSVCIQCMLPFRSSWENKVDAKNIPVFKEFRRVVLLYYLFNATILVLQLLILQKIINNLNLGIY